MTRIRVNLDLAGEQFAVRLSCPEDAAWKAPERTMRRGTSYGYPLPPLEDAASWQGEAHAALCSADEEDDEPHHALHNRIFRDPDEDDLGRVGGYLFAALFGSAWTAITERFPEAQGYEIEIHGSAAAALDFVPWEMMANGTRPLIAQGAHSISRLVTPEQPAGKVQIDLPLRVLFVVGEMDDVLRPGAEYLGILRNLESAGGAVTGSALHVRTLTDAQAVQIEETVASFRPSIVHIVAHGLVDGAEPSIRLTKTDPNKNRIPDPCSAERLLGLLRGPDVKNPLPPIVIVNACHTADAEGEGEAQSFAARLVRGGVSAAAGMAGEVASNACRLFTKAAYAALAEKRSLQQAVARGQRAARLHYEKYGRSAEWARPALFIAEGAELDFQADAQRIAILEAAARTRGNAVVMCDRYSQIRAYEQFAENNAALKTKPGAPRILAFEVSTRGQGTSLYQLGKSHLLEDLSWRALLDGYVTCLVPSTDSQPPPHNLLLFAIKLAEVMDDVRERFGIERRETSAAQRRAFKVLGHEKIGIRTAEGKSNRESFDDALDEVKTELRKSGASGPVGVEAQSIGNAIRTDIADLLSDVRAKCPQVRAVLVLLDDLHKYVGYFQPLLDQVKDFGLGSSDAPAPLIVTYSTSSDDGPAIYELLKNEALPIARFTQRQRVDPFPATAEGRLAYSQYVLARGYASTRDRALQPNLDIFFKHVHTLVEGVPSSMTKVDNMLSLMEGMQVLIKADDEAIFKVLQDEK